MKQILNLLIIGVFFVLLFSATATTSIDFSQDLGRHLKLGELIIKTGTVPSVNLFSYTFPQFPFINHHWLSEVIFYFLYEKIVPVSLLILKILLVLSAFLFVIKTAHVKSNTVISIISAFIFFPLFLERNDIRPELFGYLFYGIFLYLFMTVKRINKSVLVIPFILIMWVNLHISFVFGIMLGFFIVVRIYIELKRNNKSFNLLWLFVLSFSIVLINPNGIKGALYPLSIFSNYGYPIVENQNVFFLAQRITNHLITYYFFVSPIVVVTILFLFFKKKLLEGLLLAIIFVLSILQIRHFPFFVLTVIPFTAWMFSSLFLFIKRSCKINFEQYQYISVLLFGFIIIFVSFFFFDNSYYKTFDSVKRFGFGFEESEKEATDFFLANRLKGNIFNNFDIGGYLTYRLYPKYQLFIDNRPEAYPSEFVQQTYIPLQENEKLQNSVFKKYGINTVVFSYTDQTPWARQFLINISQNKNWKLVFLNPRISIFTKNTNLVDVRSEDSVLKTRIEKENNYINLLHYAEILSIINKTDLSNTVLEKAYTLGPDSCSLKRFTAEKMINSNYFLQVDGFKKRSFWCF